MIPIYLKTIVNAEEEVLKFDDKEYQEKLENIEKRQPHLDAYISAALDSFEDEDEFADKFLFYVLVIHQSFTAVKRFFPPITPDVIKTIEEEEIAFFDKLDHISEEEGEIAIDQKISNHPQKHLLRYLQAELNEDEEETDDHIEDLNIHIFWLLSAITAMYDKALELSGFDPADGRDGMDIREKKELREKKKLLKKKDETREFKDTQKGKPKFDKPKHDRKFEERPKRDGFIVEKPKFDDRPKREPFYEEKPRVERKFDDRPRRDDSVGEKPKLVKKSDLGNQSSENRPRFDKHQGDKPFKRDDHKKPKGNNRDEYFKPKF